MTKTSKLKRVAEAGFAAIKALLESLLCSSVFSDKPFSSCWAPFTAWHILENRDNRRMYEDQEIYVFSSTYFEMEDR